MNPTLPAFALVACLGIAMKGIAMIRERGAIVRLEADVETKEAPRKSIVGQLLLALNKRLAPTVMGLLGRRRLDKVRLQIDSAGRPNGMTVQDYAGRKGSQTVLMFTTGVLLLVSTGTLIPLLTLTPYGWIGTDIWLSRKARLRQREIDKSLPDFLDVVAVSVSAGVSFRPALKRVADSLGGPMGDEATIALQQMELGSSRREAFIALRDRNESQFIAQFVTALLQAEELGVPLSDSLVAISREMRGAAYQRGRREAARAAPRVSLIVSMLIVPGAMILTLTALFIGSNIDFGELL